jgi:hypothetical protein
MTDRIKGFVVALDKDLRDDDVQETLNALRMIKGVVSVNPVIAKPGDDQIIRMRLENEFREKLLDLFHSIGSQD